MGITDLIWYDVGALEGIQGPTGPQGPQGEIGPANTLTIGTVTTLPTGQNATASITGTAPNQVLNLGIPRGLPGADGTAVSVAGSEVSTLNFTTDPQTQINNLNTTITNNYNSLNLSINTTKSDLSSETTNRTNADNNLQSQITANTEALNTKANTTTSNTFTGNQTINGNLNINGELTINGGGTITYDSSTDTFTI